METVYEKSNRNKFRFRYLDGFDFTFCRFNLVILCLLALDSIPLESGGSGSWVSSPLDDTGPITPQGSKCLGDSFQFGQDYHLEKKMVKNPYLEEKSGK